MLSLFPLLYLAVMKLALKIAHIVGNIHGKFQVGLADFVPKMRKRHNGCGTVVCQRRSRKKPMRLSKHLVVSSQQLWKTLKAKRDNSFLINGHIFGGKWLQWIKQFFKIGRFCIRHVDRYVFFCCCSFLILYFFLFLLLLFMLERNYVKGLKLYISGTIW